MVFFHNNYVFRTGLEKVKRHQYSLSSTLEQCGTAESMSSEVVEQAVNTCENITMELSDQWQDMMELRQILHNLPMKLRLSVSPIKIEREISHLQEMHAGTILLSFQKKKFSFFKKFSRTIIKVCVFFFFFDSTGRTMQRITSSS